MAEQNRQWILVKRPDGPLTDDCFALRGSPVPALKDGEFLVRNQYLSCDPTQRAWIEIDTYLPKVPLGEVVRAAAAGTVVASRHRDFQEGDAVPVIATTSTAANLTCIVGGILVFGDALAGGVLLAVQLAAFALVALAALVTPTGKLQTA